MRESGARRALTDNHKEGGRSGGPFCFLRHSVCIAGGTSRSPLFSEP